MSYLPAPSPSGGETAIRALLIDLASRKEFQSAAGSRGAARWDGYALPQGFSGTSARGPEPPPEEEASSHLFLPGLRLNGAQHFIRNFANPDTAYPRVLVKWQTGTGKSIAAISIGQEFVRQYRARAALGERAPTVFVISFTARETIQEDMLRHPEFGFVSQAEVEELRRLRAAVGAAGGASPEARPARDISVSSGAGKALPESRKRLVMG